MGRLVLHIGTHKTATTSIQRFLRKNQDALLERGVYYPNYDLIGKKGHYAHFGMVNALNGESAILTREEAQSFFRSVAEIARDRELTIVSAESFYRQGWASNIRNPEDYWRTRRDYIREIRDLVGEAEIVVVFRTQADYADSLYQENIKATKTGLTFRRFLEAKWPHFRYADQARAWNEAFPGLRAFSYHRLVETGDAVAEFCRLLSIPIEGLPPAARFNESMPADLVALKRLVNGSKAGKDELIEKLTRLGQVLPGVGGSDRPPHSFFADETARQAFQDSHAAANEELRPFMGHPLVPGEPVLPLALRPVKTYGDAPSPEFLLALIDRALGGGTQGPGAAAGRKGRRGGARRPDQPPDSVAGQ